MLISFIEEYNLLVFSGGCALPIALQGRQMPIISDAECTQRWPGNFSPDSMVCVFDNGGGGACNVSTGE